MGFQRRLNQEKECIQCHNTFTQKTYNQVFCSNKCRNDHYNDWKHKAFDQMRKSEKQTAPTGAMDPEAGSGCIATGVHNPGT